MNGNAIKESIEVKPVINLSAFIGLSNVILISIGDVNNNPSALGPIPPNLINSVALRLSKRSKSSIHPNVCNAVKLWFNPTLISFGKLNLSGTFAKPKHGSD